MRTKEEFVKELQELGFTEYDHPSYEKCHTPLKYLINPSHSEEIDKVLFYYNVLNDDYLFTFMYIQSLGFHRWVGVGEWFLITLDDIDMPIANFILLYSA